MIRFNNDYNRGAHPAVLEALVQANGESYPGYGLDAQCERAERLIRDLCASPEAKVHFLPGGTQANATVIAAALRPYESAVSADTGHINVHETGAVESSGHKIQALPSENGKITADQVRACAEEFRTSPVPEHVTAPKLVYLSFPTEFGTLYAKSELEGMRRVCDEYGLYLFVDGARLAYGLAAPGNDVTMADLARLADAFTIGGTKCGALFGEAVVLANRALDRGFRSIVKQRGGMTAKGWLLGLQFCALLESGCYFDLGKSAVSQAMRIKEAFAQAGIASFIDSPTNQQFVVMDRDLICELSGDFAFDPEGFADDGTPVVRFCTSWSTTDAEVDALVEAIGSLRP